jgi:hypothetical protein
MIVFVGAKIKKPNNKKNEIINIVDKIDLDFLLGITIGFGESVYWGKILDFCNIFSK